MASMEARTHEHRVVAKLLQQLDIGCSIAEQDTLLKAARVETSAFTDLLRDKVDLVPGTKGSGKSALFRIFVDFLPEHLLQERKVVIAHGVQKHGDNVFHAFKKEFTNLGEDDFVGFWCIYLTSLAHEQFIKGGMYQSALSNAAVQVDKFRRACVKAHIPEVRAQKSLRDIIGWALAVLGTWSPRLRLKLPNEGGELEVDLFGERVERPMTGNHGESQDIPQFMTEIKESLESVLHAANLSMWLMIDRLDEIFPRRTKVETLALRGLLRTMRLFTSPGIRIKLFLRDDMLEQAVSTAEGFTALTHITARQADTLRWSEDQILTMLTKRLFSNAAFRQYLDVDADRLDASQDYRKECFYRDFPPTGHSGPNQSPTLRWLYNHTMDGKGVVTPRDILDLVTRAKQTQQDTFNETPESTSPYVIGSQAIQYGLEELSKRRKETYLKAEFPHHWTHIEKFVGGKSEYSRSALQRLLKKQWEQIADDLISIGFLRKRGRGLTATYWIPYLYRKGLDLTQGKA